MSVFSCEHDIWQQKLAHMYEHQTLSWVEIYTKPVVAAIVTVTIQVIVNPKKTASPYAYA